MKYPWMFCLTLLLGLGKENGPAVGLAGGGAPDFEAFENLLKNVSHHREPGKECFQISFNYVKFPRALSN